MQGFLAKLCRKMAKPAIHDVVINHRGIDTKRTITHLLYDRLMKLGVKPFVDNINMRPGDRLFDHIDEEIVGSKVGVAVFSPHYYESYFCLYELALLFDSKKRIVPIFYDVKPSQLQVKDNVSCTAKEFHRFNFALEEAKYTVGLTFNSSNGNWAKLVQTASDAVIWNLLKVEEEQKHITGWHN